MLYNVFLFFSGIYQRTSQETSMEHSEKGDQESPKIAKGFYYKLWAWFIIRDK